MGWGGGGGGDGIGGLLDESVTGRGWVGGLEARLKVNLKSSCLKSGTHA